MLFFQVFFELLFEFFDFGSNDCRAIGLRTVEVIVVVVVVFCRIEVGEWRHFGDDRIFPHAAFIRGLNGQFSEALLLRAMIKNG